MLSSRRRVRYNVRLTKINNSLLHRHVLSNIRVMIRLVINNGSPRNNLLILDNRNVRNVRSRLIHLLTRLSNLTRDEITLLTSDSRVKGSLHSVKNVITSTLRVHSRLRNNKSTTRITYRQLLTRRRNRTTILGIPLRIISTTVTLHRNNNDLNVNNTRNFRYDFRNVNDTLPRLNRNHFRNNGIVFMLYTITRYIFLLDQANPGYGPQYTCPTKY